MEVGTNRPLTPEEAAELTEECFDSFDAFVNRWPKPIRDWDSGQVVEWEGEGVTIKDITGRTFIDCLGGYGVFTLGHRHPEVIAAVKAQLDRLALHSQKLLNPIAYEAAKRLAKVSPGDLKRTFFTNSGTEAVEGALKLARLYTRKPKFVSTVNSFHGKTLGSLSVTGRDIFRKPMLPLLAVSFVPFGDAGAVERAIDDETCAVIVEPIQGEGGVHVPPDDYLPALREITRKKNVLLIVDEVQTGLGRTGKMFGVDHWGVVPDIMCLAKGLSGGVIPCGAFHTNDEIWRSFHPLPLFQTSTFGSNPLAVTCAAKTIEITARDRLPERAAETGAYFLGKLEELIERLPGVIREARGKGLLIGLEAITEELGTRLAHALFDRDVLVANTLNNPRVIRIEPPLIIERAVVDEVLGRMEAAMKAVRAAPSGR
ncbi:MAG: aminotransferase class III-fold pyridoxal phosphate-dependent enzyme [Candidatus Riflebacteria bacterium]|nr:aminotransferase class III-fold pyridoxal phosphate-dependent enzyme [Candidatus Riflebacteria bacterium]